MAEAQHFIYTCDHITYTHTHDHTQTLTTDVSHSPYYSLSIETNAPLIITCTDREPYGNSYIKPFYSIFCCCNEYISGKPRLLMDSYSCIYLHC